MGMPGFQTVSFDVFTSLSPNAKNHREIMTFDIEFCSFKTFSFFQLWHLYDKIDCQKMFSFKNEKVAIFYRNFYKFFSFINQRRVISGDFFVK